MKSLRTAIIKGIFPLLFGFFAFYALPANAQNKAKTVKGEVVDLSCYITKGAKGKSHQMCAQMCLKKGLPAGLLTKDGQLYLLIENHKKSEAYSKLPEYAQKEVAISGHLSKKNGLAAITVEQIKPMN